MSATTAGAVKAHLEAAATGIAWYRDRVPADVSLPYGTIDESIDTIPQAHGDIGDPAADNADMEIVQVNIWQAWRNADGSPGEDYLLPGKVVGALRGARLATAPTLVYGVIVRGMRRLLEVDKAGRAYDTNDQANVVHHAITVNVHRRSG